MNIGTSAMLRTPCRSCIWRGMAWYLLRIVQFNLIFWAGDMSVQMVVANNANQSLCGLLLMFEVNPEDVVS